MEIKKISVMGAGLMGSGIAQVCAQTGYMVTLRDIEQGFVDNGMKMIKQNLSRDVEKGRKTNEEMEVILSRIISATDLGTAAHDTDIVVEAILEVLDVKKKLFDEL
jgi:3-hydroxybutyryl-CoA dehydrogenase